MMLASDADRDSLLSVLREAYAAGRITIDELSERVTRTLTARTVEELDGIVSDLRPQRRLPARSSSPVGWYPAYGQRMPRRYGSPGPRFIWPLPLVLVACFWWVPFAAGWHFFFFPFVFFGGFWLFALWRRALRF
jgi:hypothetical protein